MKRINLFIIVAVALTAIVACNQSRKKQNEVSVKTAKDTLNWSGTYEGIMPNLDSSGVETYILLALSSDGKYNMFQKQIGRVATYASKGDVQWNTSNDSLRLGSGGDFFQVSGSNLKTGAFSLRKISNEANLDEVYFSYCVKHNKTGNNYMMKIYSEGDVAYAEFEFEKKQYKLKINMDNSQEQEFSDGTARLVWNIISPAPLANYKPVFYDGKNTHDFTVLSPSNTIYKAKKDNAPVKVFDVLYFNHEEGKSFTKIMSPDTLHCYVLRQTEASAKTADYENETVKWEPNNRNGATLILNGNKFEYIEAAF